jgi:hypothetical protein
MRGAQGILRLKGFAAFQFGKWLGTPDREHEKPPFL